MGKKIKWREARRHASEEAVAARLRAHSRTETGPASIGSYDQFTAFYRAKIERYRGFALRMPEHWRCRLRSRLPEKRFLELVRFTFAKYPAARHLEDAWVAGLHAFADRVGVPVRPNDDGAAGPDFCRWYIDVAQGRSLYREAAHVFMSKLETHHFLSAPEDLGSSQRAFWYAYARAQTPDVHVAHRVARSKLAGFPAGVDFWKEVARYFARNPLSVPEMNDLIDFFDAAKAEDDSFSLRGRSLEALRRRMDEWHRTLRKREIVCGGHWAGHPLPDVIYETGSEHRRAIWRFRQIRTGNDLFREGQRMHHCVVTYKQRCIDGDLSIWSLTCEFPIGRLHRGVTLELRNNGEIVQCRGFANRLPFANEVTMVKRWAREYGLTWCAVERA